MQALRSLSRGPVYSGLRLFDTGLLVLRVCGCLCVSACACACILDNVFIKSRLTAFVCLVCMLTSLQLCTSDHLCLCMCMCVRIRLHLPSPWLHHLQKNTGLMPIMHRMQQYRIYGVRMHSSRRPRMCGVLGTPCVSTRLFPGGMWKRTGGSMCTLPCHAAWLL